MLARLRDEESETAKPRRTLAISRSQYRHRSCSARATAVAISVAIHVLLTAIVIYDWQWPKKPVAQNDVIVVNLLPQVSDEPAKRPERGVVTNAVPPRPALAVLPSPMMELPKPPAIIAAEPLTEPPIAADGGKSDQLAQATQAYRRVIMAELEAERRYPRPELLDGYHGAGAILFHIDRDGRLLDVAVEASTGRKALDRAALALVRRAAPFPAIPEEMPDQLEIGLPIRFLIVEPGLRMTAR